MMNHLERKEKIKDFLKRKQHMDRQAWQKIRTTSCDNVTVTSCLREAEWFWQVCAKIARHGEEISQYGVVSSIHDILIAVVLSPSYTAWCANIECQVNLNPETSESANIDGSGRLIFITR